MKLIGIGNNNYVSAERIISIIAPDSAPVKRIIQDARDTGALIDGTFGKKTKAVIFTDSSHVILSSLSVQSLVTKAGNADE